MSTATRIREEDGFRGQQRASRFSYIYELCPTSRGSRGQSITLSHIRVVKFAYICTEEEHDGVIAGVHAVRKARQRSLDRVQER